MDTNNILVDFLVDRGDWFPEDLNIDVDDVDLRLTLNELLTALRSIRSFDGEVKRPPEFTDSFKWYY